MRRTNQLYVNADTLFLQQGTHTVILRITDHDTPEQHNVTIVYLYLFCISLLFSTNSGQSIILCLESSFIEHTKQSSDSAFSIL